MISAEVKPAFDGHELLTAFFIQFARFEYAMKKAGYINDRADANWDNLFKVDAIRRNFENPPKPVNF